MPITTSTPSFFIELLRTREWRQYSNLFPYGTTQLIIPVFPRNQTIWTIYRPPGGIYAYILYGAVFGINMLPDVFTYTYNTWGSQIYSGTVTQSVIGIELASFIPITDQQTVQVSATNTTNLLQYFELLWRFLVIRTEAEWQKMVDVLERVAVSLKSEAYLAEIKEILKRMEGAGM